MSVPLKTLWRKKLTRHLRTQASLPGLCSMSSQTPSYLTRTHQQVWSRFLVLPLVQVFMLWDPPQILLVMGHLRWQASQTFLSDIICPVCSGKKMKSLLEMFWKGLNLTLSQPQSSLRASKLSDATFIGTKPKKLIFKAADNNTFVLLVGYFPSFFGQSDWSLGIVYALPVCDNQKQRMIQMLPEDLIRPLSNLRFT